jgi:hypothetical protein
MLRAGGGWTTDLRSLAAIHRMLGLAPARDGLAAWEAPQLVLVTAPGWFDSECDVPANVVHAATPYGSPRMSRWWPLPTTIASWRARQR